MGATNIPQTLDDALKRAGRFDRTVTIHVPDVKARKDIIKLYTGDKSNLSEKDFDFLVTLYS